VEQGGTGEQPLNDRPEGPRPPAEGASGGEAGYLFDWDDRGNYRRWDSTFLHLQRGVDDLGTLLLDPHKRDRTQAVEQVEYLIGLLQELREELDTRATTPAPSADCPGQS
jgi:hypothetical protein